MASERVEEARARFRITGASQYPFLNAQAQFTATRSSVIGSNTIVPPGASLDASYTQAGVGALLGTGSVGPPAPSDGIGARAIPGHRRSPARRRRVAHRRRGRRLFHPARARSGTGDRPRQRATSPHATSQLVRLRHDRGAATGLDVHQAEQFLYLPTRRSPARERDIGQAENALSLLVGKPPGDIARGKAIDEFVLPPELPPGLPSSLLERRPDIRQAEQNADCRQRADRRGEGVLLPADLADRLSRRPEPCADRVVHGPARLQDASRPRPCCPSSTPARFAPACASPKRRSARC